MEDIRFLGVQGENLLLETESGDQYRLSIDDNLRRLIRKETAASEIVEQISPREIQIEIRSGVTVQELAERTGASIDYIEKFAATVIDELQHVISSALAVRILVPGDRFNEPVHAEFGEIIAERLSKNRATSVAWSSKKDESGTWQVQCSFSTSAGAHEAMWSFDIRKLVLTPENDTAMQLQMQTPLVAPSKSAAPSNKQKPADDPLAPTGSIPQSTAAKGKVADSTNFATLPVEIKPAIEETKVEIGNLATTTDLTDILKKRAAEAAATTQMSVIDEPAENTASITLAPVKEPETNAVQELDSTQPIEAPVKKGRVPVQSWEEILLSTKSEDDQAN